MSETENEEPTDVVEVAETEDEAREPEFLGLFDSFDHVRDELKAAEDELVPGDLAVVNGALVRVSPDLAFEALLTSIVDEYALPADHTERFSRALVDMERVVLSAEFEDGSLLNNLRDTILGMFKGKPKLWSEMSQQEQRDTAKQVEGQAKTIIRKIARVIAEGEEVAVHGKLESYSNNGGFTLKLTAQNDEDTALELFRLQGHDVVIVSADAERFLKNVKEAETEPDQLDLEDAIVADDEPETEELETEIPEDDSDLAGEDDDEPGEDLEDDDAADFNDEPQGSLSDEADETVRELDGEAEESDDEEAPRDDIPEADFTGAEPPQFASVGDTWVNPESDDIRVRYYHGEGRWLLKAPAEPVDDDGDD